MAFTCKFPDVADIGDKSSGSIYYAEYTNAGNNTRLYNIRSLITVDMSDFNENTQTTAATGKRVDLCEFSNGVKMFCSIYNQNGSIMISYGFYKGNSIYWKDNISGNPGFTIAAAKTYGIKISCQTIYPQVSAVDGVTEALQISFMALIPYISGQSLQSYAHIGNGTSYTLKYESGVPVDLDNPGCMFYPDGTGIMTESFMFNYALTDGGMTALIEDIKRVDPSPINIEDIINIINPGEDPTQDDNPSGPGGGGGSGAGNPTRPGGDPYDPRSDPIDFPALPTGGPIASGAIKTFAVSAAVLTQLFNKLWNTSVFDVSTWQKLLEAPLDSIIGLNCIPITPTASQSGAEIKIGSFESGVSAPVVTQQYYTIDCGSVKIPEYWGSALDYSPYTKFQIYLPFIGIKDIQIDDAVGLTLNVKYNYDILSGNLTANIKCGKSVLYKFNGNVKQSIPISSYTNTQLENALRTLPTMASAATGAGATGAMVGAALNVAMSKTNVQRTGDLSGSTGLLDDFVPYVIVHRPMQSLAADFKGFKGYPSNITAILNTLSGYTEVEYIHLTGIDGATDQELNEIESLLKAGVII